MTTRRRIADVAAWSITALLVRDSGAQGNIHYEVDGGPLLGAAVATLRDVNDDGCDDYIVADPGHVTQGVQLGKVFVKSGASGLDLYSIVGDIPSTEFGVALARVGDVDQDGDEDFLMGGIGTNGSYFETARLYSGPTGQPIFIWNGFQLLFGSSVSSAGDVDADGFIDLAVGAPGEPAPLGGTPPFGARGTIYVYSGRTGASIAKLWNATSRFGQSCKVVAAAGDVDLDGRDDLAFSVIAGLTHGAQQHEVHVVSPASMRTLHVYAGDQQFDDFGQTAIASASDLDRDGVIDLIVGAPSDRNGIGTKAGSAYVFSGASGRVLALIKSQTFAGDFARAVGLYGDKNGDDYPDLVIGGYAAKHPYLPGEAHGGAAIVSGKDFKSLGSVFGSFKESGAGARLASNFDANRDGIGDVLLANDPHGPDGVNGYQLATPHCGKAKSLGPGCPNASGGQPVLSYAAPCLVPGAPLSLTFFAGNFGATIAFLVIGPDASPIAMTPSCTFYPAVPVTILALPTGILGTASVSGKMPAPVTQYELAFQAFVPAPGTALGYAATNAIRVTLPQ